MKNKSLLQHCKFYSDTKGVFVRKPDNDSTQSASITNTENYSVKGKKKKSCPVQHPTAKHGSHETWLDFWPNWPCIQCWKTEQILTSTFSPPGPQNLLGQEKEEKQPTKTLKGKFRDQIQIISFSGSSSLSLVELTVSVNDAKWKKH